MTLFYIMLGFVIGALVLLLLTYASKWFDH